MLMRRTVCKRQLSPGKEENMRKKLRSKLALFLLSIRGGRRIFRQAFKFCIINNKVPFQ